MARFACTLPLLLLGLVAAGCGDDETTPAPATTATASTGGSGGSGATGGGGSGGAAGGGGDGGTGATFAFGDPIEAPDEEWTWVDFPESRCMNDTPTGIGVNPMDDTKVLIFLQGGNACFNLVSCSSTANPNGYDADNFASEIADVGSSSAFDRTAPENAFRDFSFVYVPYCTGDIHSGNRPDADVGGQTRHFRGYLNFKNYLERIVPTFPNVTQVVVAGVSAGGFGAAYNYDQVARAFGPGVEILLIDDSGPPMAPEFVPPCLQKHFRDTWNLTDTLPPGCDDCQTEDGTFTEQFVTHIVDTYPEGRFALLSYTEDETIRLFWSFGQDDCANVNAFPSDYPAAQYTDGLIDIRDRMVGDVTNFKLFMVDGTEHVVIQDPPWTVEQDGVNLGVWLQQFLDGDAAWDHVPVP